MAQSLATFKSPQAEQRYLAAYEAVLQMWPLPYQTLQVATNLGQTFLVASGSPQSPPLLLLPGFGASATMWVPMIGALSQEYRTFALDTIGDLGRSSLNRKLSSANDFVGWLDEVIQALNFDQVHLLGFSQGGWMALNFAICAPERVRKLVLISPNAGLVPISLSFMLRLMLMAAFPFPGVIQRWAKYNSTAWNPKDPYTQLILEQMQAGTGGQNIMRSGVMPTTFKDEELQQLRVETLLMVGEQEVVNDAQAAIRRAKALIPRVEVNVLPGARHMLPFDQPQIASEMVLRFLKIEAHPD